MAVENPGRSVKKNGGFQYGKIIDSDGDFWSQSPCATHVDHMGKSWTQRRIFQLPKVWDLRQPLQLARPVRVPNLNLGIYRCNTKPGPNMGDLYDIHNVICLNFRYDIIHINSLQFHFFWDEHSNLIYTKNRFGHRKETGTTQNLKSNCLSPNIAALVP